MPYGYVLESAKLTANTIMDGSRFSPLSLYSLMREEMRYHTEDGRKRGESLRRYWEERWESIQRASTTEGRVRIKSILKCVSASLRVFLSNGQALPLHATDATSSPQHVWACTHAHMCERTHAETGTATDRMAPLCVSNPPETIIAYEISFTELCNLYKYTIIDVTFFL